MTAIEIKAKMFDLLSKKNSIEYEANQFLKELEAKANEIKNKATFELKPIMSELAELQNILKDIK